MNEPDFFKAYRKINNGIWVEWIFRIFFTLEFIQTGLVMPEDGTYPDICWLMLLIAAWCYFFKFRLAGFIPLILSMLLHYFHVPYNS